MLLEKSLFSTTEITARWSMNPQGCSDRAEAGEVGHTWSKLDMGADAWSLLDTRAWSDLDMHLSRRHGVFSTCVRGDLAWSKLDMLAWS